MEYPTIIENLIKSLKVIEVVAALLIVIALGVSFTAPYFEAKAFNECTGGNATYVVALFTELRIENCK